MISDVLENTGLNEAVSSLIVKLENFFKKMDLKDGSHDMGHFRRVWNMSKSIAKYENGNLLVLAPAAYFHDLVNYPKDSEIRSKSSNHSAHKAVEILKGMNYPAELLNDVFHAIEAHSFSAEIPARTIEAKILQDADRLESIGTLGIMRTFYVSGILNTKMFDSNDPFAKNRELNDKRFAVDHFYVKLLKLENKMNTRVGKQLAKERTRYMRDFLNQLDKELNYRLLNDSYMDS